MTSPADWGLPFSEFRDGQFELAKEIAGRFEAGAKHVLVQAPPGVGKTALAILASRLLSPSQTLYLTSTKQLQDQYMTMGGMVDMRGRPNFRCKIDDRLQADWGNCTFGIPCDFAGPTGQPGCDYYDAKRRAIQSREVVTNYSYALRNMSADSGFKPELLVCDEAHELGSEMSSYLSRPLKRADLAAVDGPAPPGGLEIDAWRRWSTMLVFPVHEDKRRARTIEAIKEFVACLNGSGERLVIQEPWGWTAKPVWAGMWAAPTVLSWSQRSLIMSATILDPHLFCRQLGLTMDHVAYFDVPSPFPVERRPLRLLLATKVSASMPEEEMEKLVETVDQILEAHPEDKGIIHTVSYRLTQEVLRRSRNTRRLLTHEAKNREQVFSKYAASTEPVVLLSPSAMVGFDAPYQGCRFQIIMKLPFPDRSDPVRVAQAKSEVGKQIAIYDTASSLVQAYGRAMRAEDDWGITYLLDGQFSWFKHAARRYLPSWFLEAVRKEVKV